MKRQSRELLYAQLQEVLTVHRADPDDPFEIAVLAGLLARYPYEAAGLGEPSWSALAAARQLLESGALQSGLPAAEVATELVDRMVALSENDAQAERVDALLDLDELCAGGCFLGSAGRYSDALSDAAGAIRAFPSLWQTLAPWASRVLAEAPPLPGDPAIWMWRAVESCRYATEAVAPPACDAARRELGIPLLVARSTVTSLKLTLYAASDLPPPAVLQPLARRAGFELGLGVGPDGQPVLVVSCSTTPQIVCNGCELPLQKFGSALYCGSALPGEYTLQVGTELLQFEVTE